MTKIATQTFGLKQELTADLTGTIEKLHAAGFDAIEPFVLFSEKQGNNAKNLWAYDTLQIAAEKMRELGMTMPSAHIGVGFGWISMPVKMIVKNILKLHESYGIERFVVSGPFSIPGEARHWASLTRRISGEVHPHGCTILYHNHDDEFHQVRYQGATGSAMDVFLKQTSPDVLLQVDIGWAGLVKDEGQLLRRYADRVASLHLKDFYSDYMTGYTRKTMPVDAFAPIGEGAIHTKEVLALITEFPHFAGTVIIDQDKYRGDMLAALGTGCENVRRMLEG